MTVSEEGHPPCSCYSGVAQSDHPAHLCHLGGDSGSVLESNAVTQVDAMLEATDDLSGSFRQVWHWCSLMLVSMGLLVCLM
jgi:hypothetical protein